MIVADTDEEAHALPASRARTRRPSRCVRACATRSLTLDCAQHRPAKRGRPWWPARCPTTFIGSPDTVVEQVRRARDVIGAGVLDLPAAPARARDLGGTHSGRLELFGKKVLPRIR